MKAKVKYNVVPNLPEPLQPLNRLASNLLFSWNPEIRLLFERIDHKMWRECNQNPVLLLGRVSQQRLDELSIDQSFLTQLDLADREFGRYMDHPRIKTCDYCTEQEMMVAYFSAEFGLAPCLPIYSGGLGILAGDHLKSASDLNVPLVGVGLLYQEGYFAQYLSSDGWQMETYPVNDFATMPLALMRGEDGEPLTVSVWFRDQPVTIMIWRAEVGRVPLYLLDTNTAANPPEIRRTTARLYGGDREMRLKQEIVLGIGGVRALGALGIEPTVIHMNEGHSAFSALERINILRNQKGLTLDAAMEVVLASTVFTTHTPVPAGNDAFDPELVRAYLENYVKELGLAFRAAMGYGRVNRHDNNEPFGMTPLALRLSAHRNGVSRLHGEVSRAMWQPVWPHHPVEDVPIEHITNGVHVPSWISRDLQTLLDRYLGYHWSEDPDNKRVWGHVENIPNTELWRTHERCREQLVAFARKTLAAQLEKRGAPLSEVETAYEVLSSDALTIGFARRFATYKRGTLLFKDPDRLERILNHPEMPVQLIIAGKAHPADHEGKELIKQIISLSREERFRRRIVFLENYNIEIGKILTAGSDVWLNTPRRPLEACGTSGMKALANGSLNLSILDGWWDEGYAKEFGWAIGKGESYDDLAAQDWAESRMLYDLLEKEVAPLFYRRGPEDIPREWLAKMRAGLSQLVPLFNSHRMVQDYAQRYYQPCSNRFCGLTADSFARANDLAAWRQKIMTSWHEVAVLNINTTDRQEVKVGAAIPVTAQVKLGSLTPDDVTVEAYFGRLDPEGDFADRQTNPLEVAGNNGDVFTYQGKVPAAETGRFGFTVRVMPSSQRLENRFAMGLVVWG